YVASPPDEVVASWLQQLRAVREVAPTVREVLLTDERPHAQLPAFFEALVSEPSLHAVELLIKSRVDWLIEGEQDLAEAAEQALRTGSVLHPYLVGFENFDAWHLKLFNKGYDAEQNAHAIELLRRLKTRYPDSFEYRRHRAHGIVLFTPWTEPEALLENARWMRKVGFAELRSAAVETRLRLYPRLPLYAKAQADGLLAESFGDAREDRASEQGYDASTPWRFADSRTAAIESACRDLRHLGLDDADLLELCTEFVLRWPGLARRPTAASGPILQALRAWGRPPRALLSSLGPRISGWDPELETVGEGARECALKEDVPREHAARLVEAYTAMGLCARVVSAHRLEQETGDHLRGDQRVKVAVARAPEQLEALVSVQRELEETGDVAPLEQAGRLLGYPACCVRALSTREHPGDNLANEREPFRRAPEARLAPELNRLGWASLVRHHLCSPDCEASLERAQAVLLGLERLDAAGARALRERLARPVLFLDYLRRAELDGRWVGESFRVDALEWLEPDAELVPARRVRSLRLDARGVVFELDDGASRRVDARAPLLVEPGRPLAQQARAALAQEVGATLTQEPRAVLRRGRRIGAFELTRLRTRGDERELRLQRDAERVELRIRPHDPARPQTIRRGRWALDVRDPLALSDDAKRAITWILRSLPR
ncbi:MAG: hypothetical protein GXP55_13780, partial [Deltaproteobacteria bacterium]|nr:hypothetical protein [Deltaproteobacteria bacterium]